MGKPKPPSTGPVIRGNTEVSEADRARLSDAGARLLAAEAEYLAAHGWTATVRANPGKIGTIFWTRKGTTLRQAAAVHLQKLDDPLLLEAMT